MFDGLPEDTTYAELLEYLRRDLRLDATVDILDGTILAALTPAGVSKFPQLPSAKKTLVSFGIFTTGTGTINNAGSGDWSLSGLAAGQATINYPTRAAIPAVLLTTDNNAVVCVAQALVSGLSTTSVQTETLAAVNTNTPVSFIVIG